jgi:hypothetical protein
MGSSTKRRTTAEKRAREQRLLERRKRKSERKAERKQAASEAREAEAALGGQAPDGSEARVPDELEQVSAADND